MNSRDIFVSDLVKFFNYYFEKKGFTSDVGAIEPGDIALQASKIIRGEAYGPALIMHGIMPRAGTVYLGELLRLHPDLFSYPHKLWEFPALQLTNEVLSLQKKFHLGYKKGIGRIGQYDFLPLFGASLIAYSHFKVPKEQRIFVKVPNVQYLNRFNSMFPHEDLLILVRDGRDLVHSTLKTWPKLNFFQVCLRWNRSARIIINTLEEFSGLPNKRYILVRYEDALDFPELVIKDICRCFDLDINRYPFEKINEISVIGSSSMAAKGTVTWRSLNRPEDFKPTEYWKQWSRIRKSIFKVIAGQSLIDIGYTNNLEW